METTVVSHYGIHWDSNGVSWLMQGRGSTNAIGLKERPPYKVQLPNRDRHCNHQIPTAAPVPNDYHWEFFTQLLDDELVRAMMPVPKDAGGAYYMEDPSDSLHTYLVLLSKLSSPIYNCVVPMWTLNADSIMRQLEQTNLQPFVVTQCEPKHSEVIAKVAKTAVYLPRKVIFSGSDDVILPPQIKRIDKTVLNSGAYEINDLMALPWENIGAAIVRRYMRREWPIHKGEKTAKPDHHKRK